MKKNILIASFLLAAFVGIAKADGWSLVGGGGAANYTVVFGTSGQVTTGSGRLLAVVLSTGDNQSTSMIVDTNTAGLQLYGGVAMKAIAMTPLLIHTSTNTSSFSNGGSNLNFGDINGIRFSRGLAVAGNNPANSVGVYWRPD